LAGRAAFARLGQIGAPPGLAGPAIMLLSSADRHADLLRCRELGVDVYLVKPVSQSDLLDAVLSALHGARRDGDRRRGSAAAAGQPAAPCPPLRVLLAEGNAGHPTPAA